MSEVGPIPDMDREAFSLVLFKRSTEQSGSPPLKERHNRIDVGKRGNMDEYNNYNYIHSMALHDLLSISTMS